MSRSGEEVDRARAAGLGRAGMGRRRNRHCRTHVGES